MKNIKSLLMLALMSIVFASCNNDPLQAGVEALKGSMPVALGEGQSINDLSYEAGNLTLNVTLPDENNNFEAIQKDGQSIATAIAYFVFGDKGALNTLTPLVKDANAGITIKFTGATTKKSFEGKIAAADAAKLAEAPSADVVLANKIAIDNLSGPYDVNDDGSIKVAPTAIDGDNVVYTLNVDNAKFDGKLSAKELKSFFVNVFTDPTIDAVSGELDLVKAAGKGAKWIYKNADNGKELTSTFSAEEVKALKVSK